jgi:hypothetical protein
VTDNNSFGDTCDRIAERVGIVGGKLIDGVEWISA